MRVLLLALLVLAGSALSADAPAVWSRRPVDLVGFGDSLTKGEGARPGHSYFELLAKALAPHFPQLKVQNLALSGSNSKSLERRLDSNSFKRRDPQTLGWVVITIGGNDLVHRWGMFPPTECAMFGATHEQARPWIANFRERLDRMVKVIEQHFPGGCEIFIANIYDPTDDQGDIENAPTPVRLPAWPDVRPIFEAYNQVLAELPQRHPHVHLVDLHTPFLGHGFHHGANAYWFTDLEHPNDAGHAAVAEAFLKTMATVKI
jgi:lysophospholipase L1-like esterase